MIVETQINFGKRVRELRKKVGWTIEDLSFESGINRNYLGDLERGKRNPTLKILKKIAMAFNISIHELMEGI